MFCTKCGNALEDNAKFCDRCGTATAVNNNNTAKIVDDEVQLSIKPKYKSIYFMWPVYALITFLMILFMLFSIISESSGFLFAGLFASAIILGISAIVLIFKKKQLQHMRYDFYKTKVEYSDSFLNKAEKEVKYKHIRECVLHRSVLNRIFGLGTIILFTNAETGFANGIFIPFVENSEQTYKQIKQLIDE